MTDSNGQVTELSEAERHLDTIHYHASNLITLYARTFMLHEKIKEYQDEWKTDIERMLNIFNVDKFEVKFGQVNNQFVVMCKLWYKEFHRAFDVVITKPIEKE